MMREALFTARSFHEFQVALCRCKELIQREPNLWRIRKGGYFKAYVQGKLCAFAEVNPSAAKAEKDYLLFHRVPVGTPYRNLLAILTEADVFPTVDYAPQSTYDEANRMFVVGEARECSQQVVSASVSIPSWVWLLRFDQTPEVLGETLQAMRFEIMPTVRPGEVPLETFRSEMCTSDVDALVKAVPGVQKGGYRPPFETVERDWSRYPKAIPIQPGCLINIADNGCIFMSEEFRSLGFEVGDIGFCPTDRLLGRPEVRSLGRIHD